MIRFLLVLNLLACREAFLTPEGSTRLPLTTLSIRAGAEWVEACAKALPVVRPLGEVEFYTVPIEVFVIAGVPIAARGFGSRVYVAAPFVDNVRIMAHEILHATRGLPGHTATDHPAIFWACGLDPRQI